MDEIEQVHSNETTSNLSGESIWRLGLTVTATFSMLLAIFHLLVGFGFLGIKYGTDVAKDVVVYLGVAIAAFTLLRVGSLIKAKLPGVELEFANTVTEKINRDTGELNKLAVEIAEIKKYVGFAKDQVPGKGAKALTTGPNLPKIMVFNDQQRKRFGERSERDNYKLSVNFLSKYNSPIVNMHLIVSKTDNTTVTSNVRFYLHQTFKPDEITVAPENGKAVLDLIATGGFTVGAWVEEENVLLELDLASEPNAPRVIREM